MKALDDKGVLALNDVSFSIHEAEILGIAGVSGNGQRELGEVLMGLRNALEGSVFLKGINITNQSTESIIKAGASFIPEDRLRRGVALDFSVEENLIMSTYGSSPFALMS